MKLAQPTPELRQKEIAFAKKSIDTADRLGAGHVRVFAGIPKGGTEVQAGRLGHRSL
jgi:sugar phosphate isomerase/epimerase